MPLRVIAAPELLAPAADGAFGMQFIIAAQEFMQFEFEPTIVVGTSDDAVLPKLLHNPMGLFC